MAALLKELGLPCLFSYHHLLNVLFRLYITSSGFPNIRIVLSLGGMRESPHVFQNLRGKNVDEKEIPCIEQGIL